MEPQSYKVVSTHAHEILVWKIISRLIHSYAPDIGGMNGDFNSDQPPLVFNNREQLEYFNSRILRLQHEIILSGKTISPIRLILQYMKELSKSYKIKALIVTKMKDLTKIP